MFLPDIEPGDYISLRADKTYPDDTYTLGNIYKVLDVNNGALLVSVSKSLNSRLTNEDYQKYFENLGKRPTADNVNHPAHYTQGGIECIDAMEAAYGTEAVITFCMCNAYKYIWRNQKKNGTEDIKKCQWYLNKMMELQNKLKKNDSTK